MSRVGRNYYKIYVKYKYMFMEYMLGMYNILSHQGCSVKAVKNRKMYSTLIHYKEYPQK